jgi:ubiquinone/menaquinone biosynthesis C-methylase UbiE
MTEKGHPYPASHALFLDSPLRHLLQPPKNLAEMLNIDPTETVVDFGCGPGFYTIEFAKRAKEVVAVDLQLGMLDRANQKADKARVGNVRFLQTEGKSLQLPDASADMVVLVTVFHEVAESESILKEFARVLKPNGKLVIAETIKKGIIPGAPVQNPASLQAEIEKSRFKLVQMKTYKLYGVFFFAKTA